MDPFTVHFEGADMTPVFPELAPGQQLHIVINHDGSIFHVNNMRWKMWLLRGQQPIKKKGNGCSIHISDFICELIGRLRLVDDKLGEYNNLPTDSPLRLPSTDACKIIYPGKNHDKWWDVTQLMKQLRATVPRCGGCLGF